MCLIVFAWQRHAEYPLILAGNRDEQYARPAQAMDWWPDAPDLLAGRDLQAGGSWLGVTRTGRYAAVTNFREEFAPRRARSSRGALVTAYLSGSDAPEDYATALRGDDYAGYSLLAGDTRALVIASNRGDAPRALAPGVYGLSNAVLDTPWPKLVRCRAGLDALIERNAVNPNALLKLLADTEPAPASEIADSELPFAIARAVSAPFIRTADYGTRCTTVLLMDREGRFTVTERRYDSSGRAAGDAEFRFDATGSGR